MQPGPARLLLLLLLTLGGLAAAAQGDVPAPSAFVLRIEGTDVFVDAGGRDGLSAGDRLSVFKRVDARHPRSGQVLQGLFTLGQLRVLEVGEGMARATASPEVLARLEVGDPVQVPRMVQIIPPPAPRPAPPPPPAKAPRAPEPPPQAEPPAHLAQVECPPVPEAPAYPAELAALRETWHRALDLPPRDRADAWRKFLAAHPDTGLAAPIRREIALLARPAAEEEKGKPQARTRLTVTAAERVHAGDPWSLAVSVVEGQPPRMVLLHHRPAGSATYATVQLREDTPHQFRTAADSVPLAAPGVEYFVESVGAGGEVLTLGSGTAPRNLEVADPPGLSRPELRGRSRVRLHYEYVDFNRFEGNDFYHLVEGDFLYRLQTALHSLRVGFGAMQGSGKPRLLLDDPTVSAKPVGFHYGYTEFELRLAEMFATIGRLTAGVTRDGLRGGVEGKFRIGREKGTSLVVGAAATQGIGQRGNLALAWDAVQGWPMSAEVIVTNEPIGEDLGVRLVYTVGRSVTDWVDLNLRLGYQLRDIDHNGASAGLGATFHW